MNYDMIMDIYIYNIFHFYFVYLKYIMDFPFINLKKHFYYDKELINEIKTTYPLVEYIDKIPNYNKFYYLVIILIIIYVLHELNWNMTTYITIIIGLISVYYLNEHSNSHLSAKTDKINSLLQSRYLNFTSNLDYDPDIITFIGDIIFLRKHNIIEFNELIKSLDLFFKYIKIYYNEKYSLIKSQIMDIIVQLKQNIMNIYQSLIHNIYFPSEIDILTKNINTLNKLLNGHIINMYKDFNFKTSRNELHTDSGKIDIKPETPKPIDIKYNAKYDYFT